MNYRTNTRIDDVINGLFVGVVIASAVAMSANTAREPVGQLATAAATQVAGSGQHAARGHAVTAATVALR